MRNIHNKILASTHSAERIRKQVLEDEVAKKKVTEVVCADGQLQHLCQYMSASGPLDRTVGCLSVCVTGQDVRQDFVRQCTRV